jgi:hypothetical protein
MVMSGGIAGMPRVASYAGRTPPEPDAQCILPGVKIYEATGEAPPMPNRCHGDEKKLAEERQRLRLQLKIVGISPVSGRRQNAVMPRSSDPEGAGDIQPGLRFGDPESACI